ncbi:hypothetical protein I4U23_015065 [Adineta vaga]|nr:hypothetical protein I4U23_015065 [Adineta vaga]
MPMWNKQSRSILFFVFSYLTYVNGGAIQLTSSNIDSVLSSHEVVFINFYANWCRFSQMLDPIYNELADKVAKEFPQHGLIAIGKVDCDSDNAIAVKYHVNKYPTLKLFRHGVMTKREYRGARQVDPFMDFIRKQVETSITKLSSPSDLFTLDTKKRYIVGHFDDENSENYKTFIKIASLLRDECNFVASTNKDDFKNEQAYYIGSINEQESLTTWSREKCIPLVREITFANAEELTEEGLPFLILFHKADDHESVAAFEREVAKQLMGERSGINCLHADGAQFLHPLQHLGKSLADLPLLAIDSFKHMFLFPDMNEISKDGKLLQFVKDLHSEKLHRDFHNPPPPTQKQPTTTVPSVAVDFEGGDSKSKHIPKTSSSSNPDTSANAANQFLKHGNDPTSPPESVFKKNKTQTNMRRHRQIALLGYPGVGKSSIAHHFVYSQFYDEYDPNIKTNLQHQCVIGGEQYDLVIVDNAGSDQYTINHSDFDNSDAYILVYAIDDRQSFEMVSKIREKIISTSAVLRIPLVLVGNKIDRKDERVVSTEEGRALARAWNVHFIEASARDIEAVKKMFEKSIQSMNNIDPTDNNNEENPIKVHPTGTNAPTSSSSLSRNGFNRKSNGNTASKDPTTKSTCIIS